MSKGNWVAKKVVTEVKSIGVIGSRSLGYQQADHVGRVVEDILGRGFRIASGGAIGTDQFVMERLLRVGKSDQATIYAPWRGYDGFPIKVRAMTRQFAQYGGSVIWGPSSGKEESNMVRVALLMRNKKLVEACYGLVAFIDGHSRGTVFTIKFAAQKRLPLVVFPVACHLPEIDHVKWVPLKCGGLWEGAVKAVYLK